ncbi:hypothetical protein ACEYW6_02440 [Nostoc sp. UIC 10607]|uniref:hypothetical protein n=1 Tax=Nostoc sp. UIC 10607 TaxID=3045935 RepID=UPI0039A03BCF
MNQEEAKYFVPKYYCDQLKLVYRAKEYQGLNAGRHECTNYDEVLNSIPSFVRIKTDIYLQIYTSVKNQANDLVTQSWAGKINSEEEKFEQTFLIPILKTFLEDISLSKNQDYPYFVCYKLTVSNWRFQSSNRIPKYEISGIKTNQEAENLANKIVQSLANKVVNEWKDHYERLAISEKIQIEELRRRGEINEKKRNEDRLVTLTICSIIIFIFFMIFGILPLTIKLFPPKAPFGKYQVNHKAIPSNWSDDKIRTTQRYCEDYYVLVKQGKSKKNPKYYALCHDLGVEE